MRHWCGTGRCAFCSKKKIPQEMCKHVEVKWVSCTSYDSQFGPRAARQEQPHRQEHCVDCKFLLDRSLRMSMHAVRGRKPRENHNHCLNPHTNIDALRHQFQNNKASKVRTREHKNTHSHTHTHTLAHVLSDLLQYLQ